MQIAVENFRSFEQTGLLDSADLNVFIGKNSSGKSSLLRLFPLMKQTLMNETSEPFLWYSPDYIDFGEYEDVLGFDKNAPITFSYNFKLSPIHFYHSDFSFSTIDEFTYLKEYSIDEYFEKVSELPDLDVSLKVSTKKEFVEKIVLNLCEVEMELNFTKNNLVSFLVNDSLIYDIKSYSNKEVKLIPMKRNLVTIVNATYTQKRKSMMGSSGSDFIDKTPSARFLFSNTYIFPEILKLFSSFLNEIEEDETDVPNDLERIIKGILIEDFLILDREHLVSNFSDFFEIDRDNTKMNQIIDLFISSYVNNLLVAIDNQLKAYFSRVKYIAPLRATAQRYYRMQGIAVSEMDASGANIPMIIANMTVRDFNSFQKWTEENFGFVIERASTHGHISILIRFGTETPRNIIDLGFGYSQLLPIIVEIWNTHQRETFRGNSSRSIPYTIVIEQPELHLHPAMQAEFVDVCIKIVENNKKRKSRKIKFVIETHSQTIINRISESIKKEKMSYESVVVNIVNINDDNKSSVKSIGFDEKGQLTEWPIGFFSPESIKYDYNF